MTVSTVRTGDFHRIIETREHGIESIWVNVRPLKQFLIGRFALQAAGRLRGGASELAAVAKQFGVSWGYSKKIRAQQLKTGQKERPAQSRHGPARA